MQKNDLITNIQFGGSWSNRIRLQRLQGDEEVTSLFYYMIFPEDCNIDIQKPKKKVILLYYDSNHI